MRLRLFSDTHLEFHPDGGVAFIESLDVRGVDVLVLAGDIAVGADIPRALSLFCARFRDAQIVYVPGNHDYFGCTRDELDGYCAAARATNPNLHTLNCEMVQLGERRFLGAPLWFEPRDTEDAWKRRMPDFREIEDLETWVYKENAKARSFFRESLKPGDIAVTHHLPTHDSVPDRFWDSPMNDFFVSPLDDIIEQGRPALWLHGHTHDTVDYDHGETRIVCNPRGYAPSGINRDFDADLIVEI